MEEIAQEVKQRIQSGESKIDIYNQLHTTENGQQLAYILNKTPTLEAKENTKGAYLLLLTIILGVVSTKILLGSELFSDSLFDMLLLVPALITGTIAYFVYTYEYSAYRSLIVWEIINAGRKILDMKNQWDAFEVLTGLAIAGLCYYLSSELFPNYTSKEKLIADENGHYPVYE